MGAFIPTARLSPIASTDLDNYIKNEKISGKLYSFCQVFSRDIWRGGTFTYEDCTEYFLHQFDENIVYAYKNVLEFDKLGKVTDPFLEKVRQCTNTVYSWKHVHVVHVLSGNERASKAPQPFSSTIFLEKQELVGWAVWVDERLNVLLAQLGHGYETEHFKRSSKRSFL